MKCPKCKAELSPALIGKAFASIGGSVTGPSKARDSHLMRQAANKRWNAWRKNNPK